MKRVISFGEIMLRLKSPERERLFQSPMLEASFGGGEANVAVSLSLLGLEAAFISALSNDAVGEAAIRCLRSYGVDTSGIKRASARTGLYFLETGSDARPSVVVYDRAGSAASLVKRGDFDWNSLFAGADWFHLTGITPALSLSAAEASLEAATVARSLGLRVSIDVNYRKKLWNYGLAAPEMMRKFAASAQVLIANEEDIQLGLGIRAEGAEALGGPLKAESYRELAAAVKRQFPNLEIVAITLRESRSADRNGWSAVIDGKEGFRVSRRYEIEDIVDRVGGGDAFAAGLIFGLLEYGEEAKALEFAVAASALKHGIPGDFNLVGREEVERLLAGDASGRVKR